MADDLFSCDQNNVDYVNKYGMMRFFLHFSSEEEWQCTEHIKIYIQFGMCTVHIVYWLWYEMRVYYMKACIELMMRRIFLLQATLNNFYVK